MSSLNSWNSHELETKKNCRCLALGGNTFVALPHNQDPLFTVQIFEDKNIAVYYGYAQESEVFSSVFVGKWKCCKNLLVGVVLQQVPGTANYKRLTLEINPVTLEVRHRIVVVSYVEGDCLSSSQEHIDNFGLIYTTKLQPVVPNCGSDFDLVIPE